MDGVEAICGPEKKDGRTGGQTDGRIAINRD